MKELETLRDALDIALLRVESGQAISKALEDAPRFCCDLDWIERWRELRERLLRGEASALEGLSNFRRSVDLQLRIRRLISRRSLLPLIQATAVGCSSVLFLLATQIFFSELFRLTSTELSVVLGLIIAGCLWIWKLLGAYKRDMWFVDWLEFMSGLATRLSWGQGLLVSWKLGRGSMERLPPELRSYLSESFTRAENYQSFCSPRTTRTGNLLLRRCQLRWEQVHQLFVANERVLPVLQKELESAFEVFSDGLERQAELLGARLMLPLFLCFAPAYLVMLLAPLIRPLMGSGGP